MHHSRLRQLYSFLLIFILMAALIAFNAYMLLLVVSDKIDYNEDDDEDDDSDNDDR